MHSRNLWVWFMGAALVALAVLVTSCDTGQRRQASGSLQRTSQPATQVTSQGHVFYAEAASYTGPDALERAQREAQVMRAKGFPATVYSSHTEFPSHTYYYFIAVSSGQFPTAQQAQVQVERLHRAGFTDAKVFEVFLPK